MNLSHLPSCIRPKAGRHRERGQSLTEAALTITVLLLLLSGLIDFGRAFFVYLAMNNAVAEGAYYASAFPTRVEHSDSPDPNNIKYRTKYEIPEEVRQLVDWEAMEVGVVFEQPTVPSPEVGSLVTVTATLPFNLIGPLPGLLGWDGVIPLSTSATQTILTNEEPTE